MPGASVLVLLLAASGLVLAPGLAEATHDTCAGAKPAPPPVIVRDRVPPASSHFYRNAAAATITPILVPGTGTNVDLFVWDAACAVLLCASRMPADRPDLCVGVLWDGTVLTYEVRYLSGPGDYTLVFAVVPP